MSETPGESAAHHAETDAGNASVDGTGLPSVDRVVEDVEALEDRPVDEHVAVFEDAHDRLRQALDDAPGDAPPDTQDG